MSARSSKEQILGRRRFGESVGALFVAILSDFVGASTARADDATTDFRVIVHPENPTHSVERRFLADAFLKDVSRWESGGAIHPLDLRADSPTRVGFSERVVRRSVAAVKSYWQQRIFSGRGLPPPELDSDAEVVRYVQRDPSAVGYVSSRADIGKARVLNITYD
jgi:hypothetical protein